MQVLLVFPTEDAQCLALRAAVQKSGFLGKIARNLKETCDSLIDNRIDVVFIDCRHALESKEGVKNPFDYEAICKTIRKLSNYSLITALTRNYDDCDVPNCSPLIKCGFNRTFTETTNINRITNELLTYELNDIGNMQRLQAAHTLFTALEYSSDPIEILNDHFKLLYVNNAFEKFTGFTLEELTGKDVSDIHRYDPQMNSIKEQISKGNIWDGQLKYPRENDDVATQQTKFIPVVMNGGKHQNYINITNLNATHLAPERSSTPSHVLQDLKNIQDTDFISSKYNLAQRKRSFDVKPIALFEGRRRHSTARVHASNAEAPISKVVHLIMQAYDKCTNESAKQCLEKAMEILRSTELYNPVTLHENDKHTNSLVSGLMSNGSVKKNTGDDTFTPRRKLDLTPSTSTENFFKNLPDELSGLLETETNWNFNIFSLEKLSVKRPLLTLGLRIMNRFNVGQYLKCDETTLANWLTLMESNYKQTNYYHNSTHASDVLHATAYFLTKEKIFSILDNVDHVGSLLAAAIHDLNHPGRTNAFLCNSNNDLAILYNDQAVLENHHSALAFQLTSNNENANIFKNLTSAEYRALRSVVIDMVLATEMSKHFEHLNKFVNKFCDNESNQPIDEDNLKLPENKILIKRILIKCADVNNPTKPLHLCKEWAMRIANEYFEQTDEEKLKGLPVVMPVFDRTNCNIPKTQLSFIEYFITDMFDAWNEFVNISEIMSNLESNTIHWREKCEKGRKDSIKEEDEEVN